MGCANTVWPIWRHVNALWKAEYSKTGEYTVNTLVLWAMRMRYGRGESAMGHVNAL